VLLSVTRVILPVHRSSFTLFDTMLGSPLLNKLLRAKSHFFSAERFAINTRARAHPHVKDRLWSDKRHQTVLLVRVYSKGSPFVDATIPFYIYNYICT